jgi:dihydrofolate synthase/folylpolyglutamate synthase
MTYQEALNYLGSFINYEKIARYDYSRSIKLDRMLKLARLLGDPQDNIKCVHIAGTKGKGSTAAFTHSILCKAGFKAGLYTSPHLISFRERIRIGDSLISERDIADLTEKIKKAADSLKGADTPTFFELYTALAYLYFNEKKADFAVYEAGLGGRLDATNIISPLACAITPLSLEHTRTLGNTLTAIAGEKAGIIKTKVPCVSAPQEDVALKVIEERCRQKMAPLTLVGRDIKFNEIECSDSGETFSIETNSANYPNLKTGLLGSHQMVNAATAIGLIEALNAKGLGITEDAIRSGIGDTKWEGRLDVVSRDPLIVLDGAQNQASAAVLAEAVKTIFKFQNLILVLGVSSDKDVAGILAELLPLTSDVVLTKSKVAERALEPAKIRRLMDRDAALTESVKDALELARKKAKSEDMILVTGSLFVVGEAKELTHAQR